MIFKGIERSFVKVLGLNARERNKAVRMLAHDEDLMELYNDYKMPMMTDKYRIEFYVRSSSAFDDRYHSDRNRKTEEAIETFNSNHDIQRDREELRKKLHAEMKKVLGLTDLERDKAVAGQELIACDMVLGKGSGSHQKMLEDYNPLTTLYATYPQLRLPYVLAPMVNFFLSYSLPLRIDEMEFHFLFLSLIAIVSLLYVVVTKSFILLASAAKRTLYYYGSKMRFNDQIVTSFECRVLIGSEMSIIDAPPSPNHVFNILEDEFEEDLQEEPREEFEDDPEEDPKDEIELEAEDDVPLLLLHRLGLLLPHRHCLSLHQTLRMLLLLLQMRPLRCHPLVVHISNVKYLERCEKKRKAEKEANSSKIHKVKKCMSEFGRDLGDEVRFCNLVENRVTKLEDKDQENAEEMEKMKKHLGALETNYALVLSDRGKWKKAFYNLMDARPDDGGLDSPKAAEPSTPSSGRASIAPRPSLFDTQACKL
nr:hypothetical protein [Tanacetum cinerariifolium]